MHIVQIEEPSHWQGMQKQTNRTSSIIEECSSKRKSCNLGRALAAHFLTYTDGSLAHFPTATRTRGAITCNRIPAIVRSAHALTNGFGSPKSFWNELIDNNASFGRLKKIEGRKKGQNDHVSK